MKYWKASRNLAVDKCMILFTSLSKTTLRIPSKPIPKGYKAWAIASKGYVLGWFWHAKKKGPVRIPLVPAELGNNKIAAVVLFLLELLPKVPDSLYVVYLDNLFTSTKLLRCLRTHGYGAASTCHTNSGICKTFVERKNEDKRKDCLH
jgi:hypothetical protein